MNPIPAVPVSQTLPGRGFWMPETKISPFGQVGFGFEYTPKPFYATPGHFRIYTDVRSAERGYFLWRTLQCESLVTKSPLKNPSLEVLVLLSTGVEELSKTPVSQKGV